MFSASSTACASGSGRWPPLVGGVLGAAAALLSCSSVEHADSKSEVRDVVEAGSAADPPNGASSSAKDAAGAGLLPPPTAEQVCDELSTGAQYALSYAINRVPACQRDEDCRPFSWEDLETCWATCGVPVWHGSPEYEQAVRAEISSGETRSACQKFWDRSCVSVPLPCPFRGEPVREIIWGCVEKPTADASVTVRRCEPTD